jgi:hypothetical protein
MMRRRALALGVVLAGLSSQATAAQQRPAATSAAWEVIDPPKYYTGTTAREQAAMMATLGEIERTLWRIPEIAHPKGFRVRKSAQGGGPPWHPHRRLPGFDDPKSVLEHSFRLFFTLPGANEGSNCIEAFVNRVQIGADAPTMIDEAGRILMVEPHIGEPNIPGATIHHGGLRWDTPDADRRSGFVTFTTRGAFPWKPVTREQFLQFWIYHAEGPDYGVDEPGTRKKLEKTTYDRWMEDAATRKKERDDAIAIAAQVQGRAAAEELRKMMEQTEREVGEQLKAQDAEERKRSQEVLSAPSQADQYRARIAAMSPAERASPAYSPYGSTELLAPTDEWARRVLTQDPEFWRVRRSRVEVHSITVAFHSSLTCGAPAVQEALWKAYQAIDWAAIKKIVDRPW